MWDFRLSRMVCVTAALGAGFCSAAADPGKRTKYDDIVDAFILYDVGRLPGPAGQKAYFEFQQMNDKEAIPALVRGVNRAARMTSSCPVVVIARKLQEMMHRTKDVRLLEAAYESLESGKDQGMRYGGYLNSLKGLLDTRLSQLTGSDRRFEVRVLKGGGTVAQLRRARKSMTQWTRKDLIEEAQVAKGAHLVRVFEELAKRKGDEYVVAMAQAIDAVRPEMKPLGRGLLGQRLTRVSDRELKLKLAHEHPEIRAAAARAVGYKGAPLLRDLARAVRDRNREVALQANASLIKMTGRQLGPKDVHKARSAEWFAASQRWLRWVARQ